MAAITDRYTLSLCCDEPGCRASALAATRTHEDDADGSDDEEWVAKAARAAWARGWRWVPGGEAWCPEHARGKASR